MGPGRPSQYNGWRESPRGQDLQAEMEINLREAYHGTSRILNAGGQKLRINTKPGAYTGQELRIRGKGHPGRGGGQKGDIYIKILVQPDPHFIRNGNDLTAIVKLDLYTAVLGGKIQVDTLSGKVNLTVPPGSQEGSRLRLKGRGMPVYGQSGVFGDLYVQLNIDIPRNLGRKEMDLFSFQEQGN